MKSFVALFIISVTFMVNGKIIEPKIEKRTFFLGEEIAVKIPVEPGKDMAAFFLSETEKVAVTDVTPSQDGTLTEIKVVTLQSGEIEIPEIDLTVDGRSFKIETAQLLVNKRTDESDMMLRDIKDTVKIFEKDHSLLWIAGTTLLLLLVAFLLWKFLKNRRKRIIETVVPVSPEEVARSYIKNALKKRDEGDYEAFVDLVTIGLRDYMSLKKKINYKEMTTFEIRRYLKKDDLFTRYSNDILTVLKLGDRFKFADEKLSEEDFDLLINGFKTIVESAEKMGEENVSD